MHYFLEQSNIAASRIVELTGRLRSLNDQLVGSVPEDATRKIDQSTTGAILPELSSSFENTHAAITRLSNEIDRLQSALQLGGDALRVPGGY
jgi:hypothetical protein